MVRLTCVSLMSAVELGHLRRRSIDRVLACALFEWDLAVDGE